MFETSIITGIKNFFSKKKTSHWSVPLLIVAAFLIFTSYFLFPKPVLLHEDTRNTIAMNGHFTLEFSSAMDRKSTVNAISFTPSIPGKFEWIDDTILQYHPEKFLPKGETVSLFLSDSAKNWFGRSLSSEMLLDFEVVGPPQVKMVTPISRENWENILRKRKGMDSFLPPQPVRLKKGQPITILFDRPIDSENNLQHFMQVHSSHGEKIRGSIESLGENAFEFFIPDEEYPFADTLTVTVSEGISSTDGGVSKESFSWEVKTDPPDLVRVSSGENTLYYSSPEYKEHPEADILQKAYVLPKDTIDFVWNTPVDLESFHEMMRIDPPRQATTEIMVDDTRRDEENRNIVSLSFSPPLARDETITIDLRAGIRAEEKEVASEKAYTTIFQTLPEPCLEFTPKRQEEKIVFDANVPLEIRFCTDITRWDLLLEERKDKTETVKSALHVTSSEEGDTSLQEVEIETDISCDADRCYLSFPEMTKKEYTLTFANDITDAYGQKIPTEGTTIHLQRSPPKPILKANTRDSIRGVYDADARPALYFSVRNITTVDVTFCEVPLSLVQEIEGKGGWGWTEFSCAASGINITNTGASVEAEENTMTSFQVPFPSSERSSPVVFWEASSPDFTNAGGSPEKIFGSAFLMNASFVLFSSPEEVHIWATGFDSGKPLSDFPVTLYNERGEAFAEGKTDHNGLLQLSKSSEISTFFASGKNEKYQAFSGSTWDAKITAWDFNLPQGTEKTSSLTGFLYTDRSIYFPDDTIFFKAILREEKEKKYHIPTEQNVIASVEDKRGNIVWEKEYVFGREGTISGEIPSYLFHTSGEYSIALKDQETNEYLSIRNARFSYLDEGHQGVFTLSSLSEKYVSGDTLDLDISAEYSYDLPLKNTSLSWSLTGSPLSFPEYSEFSFAHNENEKNYPRFLSESGTLSTNPLGDAHLSLPLEASTDQLVTLDLMAKTPQGSEIIKKEQFSLFTNNEILGLRIKDFWLSEFDETLSAEVIALDGKGNSLSEKSFTAKLQKKKWKTQKKQTPYGDWQWENVPAFIDLSEKKGKTKIGGKTEVSFSLPQEEDFFGELQVTLFSEAGDILASESIFRVREKGSSPPQKFDHDRIKIDASTTPLQPGDVLSFFPRVSIAEPTTALVTLQNDTILHQEVVSFDGTSPLSITIPDVSSTNAFLSVVLSKGKGEYGAIYRNLKGYWESEQKLEDVNTQLESLQKKESSIEKEMEDAEGALAEVFQKSLEKVQKDQAPLTVIQNGLEKKMETEEKIIRDFLGEESEIPPLLSEPPHPEGKIGILPIDILPKKHVLDIDIHSEKASYLPEEEVLLTITAKDGYGNPVEGADLSVSVVPKTVSTHNPEKELSFLIPKYLGVRTSTSLTNLVYETSSSLLSAEDQHMSIPSLFSEERESKTTSPHFQVKTAFWKDSIHTNGFGKANISFFLPEISTDWEIVVVGHTPENQFGYEVFPLSGKTPVSIISKNPEFLRPGDITTLKFSIQNETTTERILTPQVSAQGLTILNSNKNPFSLAPNEKKDFTLQALVNGEREQRMNTFTNASLAISLNESTRGYAYENTLHFSLLPPPAGKGFSQSNRVISDTEKIKFTLPPHTIQTFGKLFFSASMNLARLEERNLLNEKEPSSEELISRILLEAVPEKDEDKERSRLEKDISSISIYQQLDGGMSFYPETHYSYPFLSAYILFALTELEKEKISVEENILNDLQIYAQKKLLSEPKSEEEKRLPSFSDFDTRAFFLYALRNTNQYKKSLFGGLYDARSQMSAEGNVFLLLLAHEKKYDAEKEMLLAELNTKKKQMPGEKIFFEKGKSTWNMGNDIRSTAIVLWALLKTNPESSLILPMTDYLLSQKYTTDTPWGNRQNSFWVRSAFSLLDQETTSHDLTLTMNSKKIFEETFQGKALQGYVLPLSELNTGEKVNTLEVASKGESIFYDIQAVPYIPADKVLAEDNGFALFQNFYPYSGGAAYTVTEAKEGELLIGEVNILIPESRYFSEVNISAPAGIEILEILTSPKSERNNLYPCEKKWCADQENWRFFHQDIQNHHITLFAEYLPAGRYTLRFLARATSPGEYSWVSAEAKERYESDIYGRSRGERFVVKRK